MSVSVLRLLFFRTWSLASNAHAYRLYVFNVLRKSISLFANPLRSAEPQIITGFLFPVNTEGFSSLQHPSPTRTTASSNLLFSEALHCTSVFANFSITRNFLPHHPINKTVRTKQRSPLVYHGNTAFTMHALNR
jgi:hypothetical protein